MAIQPSPRRQIQMPATLPTQEPTQLGMTQDRYARTKSHRAIRCDFLPATRSILMSHSHGKRTIHSAGCRLPHYQEKRQC